MSKHKMMMIGSLTALGELALGRGGEQFDPRDTLCRGAMAMPHHAFAFRDEPGDDEGDETRGAGESELDKLNRHIDARVEAQVEERMATRESELVQRFAAHTPSRTSPWIDYDPSRVEIAGATPEARARKAKAVRHWVEAALRSWQKEERVGDLTKYVDKEFAKRILEPHLSETRAAPIAHSTDGGDQVLEQPLYEEIINLLRPHLVITELGVTIVPMTSKTLDLPREKSKATFSYEAEASHTDSQYDFDQKQLVAKKLMGTVPVTNDFLAMNPRATSAWITARMIEDFAVEMERAVIDSKAGGPESLFSGIAAANKLEHTAAAGKVSDLTAHEQKIHALVEAVADEADAKNVPLNRIKVLCGLKYKNWLKRQRSGGSRIFPEVRGDTPMLDEFPLLVSTLIGNSYDDSGDGDSDETRLFAGDFSAYWLGILMKMQLDISPHELFSDDESVFRMKGHHDGGVTRGEHLSVLSTDISS